MLCDARKQGIDMFADIFRPIFLESLSKRRLVIDIVICNFARGGSLQ